MERAIDEKLSAILEWAVDNDWFDTSFVISVQDYHEKFERVTDRQEAAIDSIIAKNKIDVDNYL